MAAKSETNPGAPKAKGTLGLLNRQGSRQFELFSQLPPEGAWIRTGLVERNLSATQWQLRRMILTSLEVLFIKTDSDTVVDRLSMETIVFVGQVNLAGSVEEPRGSWMTQASSKNLTRRGSVLDLLAGGQPAAAGDTLRRDSSEEGGDGFAAGKFALEIRVDAAGEEGRTRSYFARVGTAEERDAWVAAVQATVDSVRSASRSRVSAITRAQVRLGRRSRGSRGILLEHAGLTCAHGPSDCAGELIRFARDCTQDTAAHLYESSSAKYVISAAIGVDFISSVTHTHARTHTHTHTHLIHPVHPAIAHPIHHVHHGPARVNTGRSAAPGPARRSETRILFSDESRKIRDLFSGSRLPCPTLYNISQGRTCPGCNESLNSLESIFAAGQGAGQDLPWLRGSTLYYTAL
jgi:hypothetical protein